MQSFPTSMSRHSSAPSHSERHRRFGGIKQVETDAVGFVGNFDGLLGGGDVDRNVAQSPSYRDFTSQDCVYIPPGNHRDEFYRLGTFGKFPVCVPASPTDLAAAGFFYTGCGDKVQCFSCGMLQQNWLFSDNVLSPIWHHTSCAMARKCDMHNIPRHEAAALYASLRKIKQWICEVNDSRGTITVDLQEPLI